MEYTNLGSSGLEGSFVGLGCNNFGRGCDEKRTAEVIASAMDNEINFFDTADAYGPGGLSETSAAQLKQNAQPVAWYLSQEELSAIAEIISR